MDNDKELENLYELARSAKDNDNNTTAAKYYDMIFKKDPTSWEACFYTEYFKALKCDDVQAAASILNNNLETVLNLVKVAFYDTNNIGRFDLALLEISAQTCRLGTLLSKKQTDDFRKLDVYARNKMFPEVRRGNVAIRDMSFFLGDKIDSIFGNYIEEGGETGRIWNDILIKQTGSGRSDIRLVSWKRGLERNDFIVESFPFNSDDEYMDNKRVTMKYVSKIRKYERSFSYEYPPFKIEQVSHKQNIEKQSNNSDSSTTVAGIIFVILIIFCVFIMSTCGRRDSNKVRWGDLSPQEQENARWAYSVSQEIDRNER